MAGNQNSGRRKTPAALHLINGNPSKLPASQLLGAGAKGAVPPSALPECPTFLTAPAKAEWKRIIGDLALMGNVARVDRAELAVYCQAYADWKFFREQIKKAHKDSGYVETTPSGYKQISVWMQNANRAEERMHKAGASFGMNPSARAAHDWRAPQGELFATEERDARDRFFD
jgi:P27 family predicted phage terminase small subunit